MQGVTCGKKTTAVSPLQALPKGTRGHVFGRTPQTDSIIARRAEQMFEKMLDKRILMCIIMSVRGRQQ